MIAHAPLNPPDIMAAGRNPDQVATVMLSRLTDPAHKSPMIQQAFRDVVQPMLTDWLADPAFCDHLRPAHEHAVAEALSYLQQRVDELLRQGREDARRYQITEGLFISLARTYAQSDAGDFEAVYRDLEAALRAAFDLATRAALPSNTGDAVQAVLAEVARLNDLGRPLDAQKFIDEAIEQQAAKLASLYELSANQARLTNQPERAARHLFERIRIDLPADLFREMRSLHDAHYQSGVHRGSSFDLAVSLCLAHWSLDIAGGDAKNRSSALRDRGKSQLSFGRRQFSFVQVKSAIDDFDEALRILPDFEDPSNRAKLKMNRANALLYLARQSLNWRDGFVDAIATHRETLAIRTRRKVPVQWARTKFNLGNGLRDFGARERNPLLLKLALAAYCQAMRIRSLDTDPYGWGVVRINQGEALTVLGQLQKDADMLRDAVKACEDGIGVLPESEYPIAHAQGHHNMGLAYTAMGVVERSWPYLIAAQGAFEKALELFGPERARRDWAFASFYRAKLRLAMFDLGRDPSYLDRAKADAMNAQQVCVQAQAEYYLQQTDALLAEVDRLALEYLNNP